MNIATLTATTGFYRNVELGVTGLPAGGTAAMFTQNAIQMSGSSMLSVVTSSTTPVGNYTLTVTAMNGTITHVTQVILVVSLKSVVNFAGFFQKCPKIAYFASKCLHQSLDFQESSFNPPGVLACECDGASHSPTFG
jgi:hypothetical protein